MADDTVDEYAYWRASLAGARPELTLNVAESGFYRFSDRAGAHAVAIWTDHLSGERIAKIGGQDAKHADEEFCERVFSRCCRSPISEELYEAVLAGKPWPDEPPATDRSNQPLDADEFATIKLELDAERLEAERWLKELGEITSQADADRATNWGDKIHQLEQRADAARKKEAAPYYEDWQLTNAKWNPLVKQADALKRKLKQAPTAFLVAKRREAEAARKQAIEEAARTAAPIAPEHMAPARPRSGTQGHVSGLVDVKTAQIDDVEKALVYFKDHPKIRETLQSVANAAVRAGATPAGCTVLTSHRAS